MPTKNKPAGKTLIEVLLQDETMLAKPTRPLKLRVNFTLDQATLDRLAAIQQAEHLDSLSATIRHLSRKHTKETR